MPPIALSSPVLILIVSQLLYTLSDFMARAYMPRHGFTVQTFLSVWFLGFIVVKVLATTGQLYVLSNMELGKTMALFGAVSIILSNVLGVLILREVLTPSAYVAVMIAIFAFLLLAFAR